jgi:hypothetical protein
LTEPAFDQLLRESIWKTSTPPKSERDKGAI